MPDLPLWPQCNIGCVFCSNPVEGFRETERKYSYEEIRRKLDKYKRGLRTFVKFDEVRDYFNLTGGEPTIHPDFLRIAALIRREFPRTLVRLLTNGRMLADRDFARRTAGIFGTPFEAAVPLFGHDAASHEGTSRAPGSFDQTVRGLRNLFEVRREGQLVEIRVIMTRVQMRSLDGLVDFILSEFPEADRVCFLFVELEGFAERYKDAVLLPMSEAAAGLDRNYEKLLRMKDARLYHFPLCAVPTRLWPLVHNTLAPFKVSFPAACGGCLYRGQCVGVHRSYQRWAGARDVAAIREPRPIEPSGDPYRPFLAHESVAR